MGAKVSMQKSEKSAAADQTTAHKGLHKKREKEEDAVVFDIDLDLLPLPVAEHICVFLSSSDVINLSKTCRFWYGIISGNSVWKKMVEHLYGHQAVVNAEKRNMACFDPSSPGGATVASTSDKNCVRYKELYFALGTKQISVFDLNITWLNDHYLVKEEDNTSQFKNVVHLQDVCWLHIKGKAKNVLPGRYKLSWRLKLEDVTIGGNTEFSAEPEAGYGEKMVKSYSRDQWKAMERKHGSGRWFVEDMGTFVVTKMCDVTLHCINIKDNWWKHGIWWDYVELKFIN